jgi:hypothetical protein
MMVNFYRMTRRNNPEDSQVLTAASMKMKIFLFATLSRLGL